jgi:hypothetical protein
VNCELFRKILAPAVHHALTDLPEPGFSLVFPRSDLLGVNVGGAEHEANSRAERAGLGYFHCGQCYCFHIVLRVMQGTLRGREASEMMLGNGCRQGARVNET